MGAAVRAKPGFISMTLHPSIDGKRIAVYAQWASPAALDDAIGDPAAMAAQLPPDKGRVHHPA
jgi:quinol monooxygenase YgiN